MRLVARLLLPSGPKYPCPMDKARLLTTLREQLGRELQIASAAQREAQSGATHEEAKPAEPCAGVRRAGRARRCSSSHGPTERPAAAPAVPRAGVPSTASVGSTVPTARIVPARTPQPRGSRVHVVVAPVVRHRGGRRRTGVVLVIGAVDRATEHDVGVGAQAVPGFSLDLSLAARAEHRDRCPEAQANRAVNRDCHAVTLMR